MSTSTSQHMTIGEFLLRRLKEAGVRHLFVVPGDYNLELLQQLQDTGVLEWVGTCSELNASYAADGYARLGLYNGKASEAQVRQAILRRATACSPSATDRSK